MGLWDSVRNQFIEVIEWTDSSNDTMVYRFPVENKEIKMGAQLTVRESQMAIFVNEGQIADVFEPGRYELSTQNMPVLTKLKSWKYLFNSPFKAEVYFVNTKQFFDQKWGTSNPILMRDKEFGMIRLRGYGIYSYKVSNPTAFLKEVFGTNESFEVESIASHLKGIIVSSLSDLISESKIAALDLATNYDELSAFGKNKLQEKFGEYGFELKTFVIENLSLPEEVEKSIDKRTSMGVIGDVNRYTQFQAADAMRDAAQNESGGFAGAGLGLGAGAAIGQMFTNSMGVNQNNQQIQQGVTCSECKTVNASGAKFCSGCGKSLIVQEVLVPCVKCGVKIKEGTKFCPECGAKQDLVCTKCGAQLNVGAKFCGECGEVTGR